MKRSLVIAIAFTVIFSILVIGQPLHAQVRQPRAPQRLGAAAPVAACCSVTSIDSGSGIVTAKVTATGATFQFKENSGTLPASLHVGSPVYANFNTKQVSLDGGTPCCTITPPPAPPPATAPAPAAGPRPAPPVAQPNTPRQAQPTPSAPTPAPPAAPAPLPATATAPAARPMPAPPVAQPTTPVPSPAAAPAPAPSSQITAIDASAGVATAKETATGKTFQFKVTDAALLNSLKVGQGVYANFAASQVSLDGISPCGTIVSSGVTGSAATAQPPTALHAAPTPKSPLAPTPPGMSPVFQIVPRIPISGQLNVWCPQDPSCVPLAVEQDFPQPPPTLLPVLGWVQQPPPPPAYYTTIEQPLPQLAALTSPLFVDFTFQNISSSTLQNVDVQLVVTPSGGGPVETVHQVISSLPSDLGNNRCGSPMCDCYAVRFSWRPRAQGTYTLTATIDPNNKFNAGHPQAYHSASIQVVEPPPSPVQGGLDLGAPIAFNSIFSAKVQNSGLGPLPCTGGITNYPLPGYTAVEIKLNPPPIPSGWGACSIDAVLFKGITLKNGWIVMQVNCGSQHPPYSDCSAALSPDTRQGTSVEMKFHGSASMQAPTPIDVIVIVDIFGTPGTSPFFAGKAVPPSSVPLLKAAGGQHGPMPAPPVTQPTTPRQVHPTPSAPAPAPPAASAPLPATAPAPAARPMPATPVAQPTTPRQAQPAPSAAPTATTPVPSPAAAPAPSSHITAIDASTGIVTAAINATGNTFQFQAADSALLNSLKIGQGVYANFAASQVSLDGISPDGTIVSSAVTGSAATAQPLPNTLVPAAAPASAGTLRDDKVKKKPTTTSQRSSSGTNSLPPEATDTSKISASEGTTEGAIRGVTASGNSPAGPTSVHGVRIKGVFSPASENAKGEADPPPHALKIIPTPGKRLGRRLLDMEDGKQIIQQATAMLGGVNMHASLLGGHKYMINNCLGIKASAGTFDLVIPPPGLSFEDGGVHVTLTVAHAGMDALSVRFEPGGNFPNVCSFGGTTNIGGYVENIRYDIAFDPVEDLEACQLGSMGKVDYKVSVGKVRLEPLPPEIGDVADGMINDALLLPYAAATQLDPVDEEMLLINRLLAQKCPFRLPHGIATPEGTGSAATAQPGSVGTPPAQAAHPTGLPKLRALTVTSPVTGGGKVSCSVQLASPVPRTLEPTRGLAQCNNNIGKKEGCLRVYLDGGLGPTPISVAVPVGVTVPDFVAVWPGTDRTVFDCQTFPVNASVSQVISAQTEMPFAQGSSPDIKRETLTVVPPVLTSLDTSPAPDANSHVVILTSGSPVHGSVHLKGKIAAPRHAFLNGKPPAGGPGLITLKSDNPAATVPTSLQVAAGNDSASFEIATKPVATETFVGISAFQDDITPVSAYGKSVDLDLLPLIPTALTLALSTVNGGLSTSGTVTLTGPAPPGDIVVQLSSNSPVGVPQSVKVPGGSSISQSFTISTKTVQSPTHVTITACFLQCVSAKITVNPLQASLSVFSYIFVDGNGNQIQWPSAGQSFGMCFNVVNGGSAKSGDATLAVTMHNSADPADQISSWNLPIPALNPGAGTGTSLCLPQQTLAAGYTYDFNWCIGASCSSVTLADLQ